MVMVAVVPPPDAAMVPGAAETELLSALAGPAVAVAVNVTGLPETPGASTVACRAFGPALLPRVQLPTVAIPSVPVEAGSAGAPPPPPPPAARPPPPPPRGDPPPPAGPGRAAGVAHDYRRPHRNGSTGRHTLPRSRSRRHGRRGPDSDRDRRARGRGIARGGENERPGAGCPGDRQVGERH